MDGVCDSLFPAYFTLFDAPLIDFVDDTAAATRHYRYGPGTLEMSSSFNGSPLLLYEGAIEEMTIDIHDTDVGSDEPHIWVGDAEATLGRGMLGPELASLLGVSQRVLYGTWGMHLDDMTFDSPDEIGSDGADNGGAGLSITVPEPQPAALLAIAMLVAAGFGRLRVH